MKNYEVEIKETLSTIVIIEAESEEDAVDRALEMYNNCEIILNESDHIDTEINIHTDTIGRYDDII